MNLITAENVQKINETKKKEKKKVERIFNCKLRERETESRKSSRSCEAKFEQINSDTKNGVFRNFHYDPKRLFSSRDEKMAFTRK